MYSVFASLVRTSAADEGFREREYCIFQLVPPMRALSGYLSW